MTEKNYNPGQKEKKAMKNAEVSAKVKKKVIKNIEEKKKVPEAVAKKEENIAEKETAKAEQKPVEAEKPKVKTKPKVKKEEAVINARNIPISTKKSIGICKFIKGKTIERAQEQLEKVAIGKKAIPMKGELSHQKGRIMSGCFPMNTAKEFIILLKGLAGNASVNDIDDPVIVEAVANLAARPYARWGKWKRKRTNIRLVARQKKKPVKKEIKK